MLESIMLSGKLSFLYAFVSVCHTEVNFGSFGKPIIGCWKLVLNWLFVLLTIIKIYYYMK